MVRACSPVGLRPPCRAGIVLGGGVEPAHRHLLQSASRLRSSRSRPVVLVLDFGHLAPVVTSRVRGGQHPSSVCGSFFLLAPVVSAGWRARECPRSRRARYCESRDPPAFWASAPERRGTPGIGHRVQCCPAAAVLGRGSDREMSSSARRLAVRRRPAGRPAGVASPGGRECGPTGRAVPLRHNAASHDAQPRHLVRVAGMIRNSGPRRHDVRHRRASPAAARTRDVGGISPAQPAQCLRLRRAGVSASAALGQLAGPPVMCATWWPVFVRSACGWLSCAVVSFTAATGDRLVRSQSLTSARITPLQPLSGRPGRRGGMPSRA